MTNQEFETIAQSARLPDEELAELKVAVEEALNSLDALDRCDGANNE